MHCWEGHLLLCGSRVEQHQRKGDASGVNDRPTRSTGIIYEQTYDTCAPPPPPRHTASRD